MPTSQAESQDLHQPERTWLPGCLHQCQGTRPCCPLLTMSPGPVSELLLSPRRKMVSNTSWHLLCAQNHSLHSRVFQCLLLPTPRGVGSVTHSCTQRGKLGHRGGKGLTQSPRARRRRVWGWNPGSPALCRGRLSHSLAARVPEAASVCVRGCSPARPEGEPPCPPPRNPGRPRICPHALASYRVSCI